MIKMYYVVFWEQYCQVVPDCWVNVREKTFTFPTSKYNITSSIKKKIDPGNDWSVNSYYKILGSYDTFKKAREAEKSCINVSTSDDMQIATLNKLDQTLPARRLITKKKFYDDTDNNNDMPYPIPNKRCKIIQHPPSNYKIHEENRATPTNVYIRQNSFESVESVINGEYNVEKQKENKTLCIAKNKPSDCNVPPALKENQFSIKVFQEDNEDEEMETDFQDYNRGIDNDKENEDLISVLEVDAAPVVEVNEGIQTTLSSLYEKVNTLHEDFQQFKTLMTHEAARNKTKIQEMLALLRENFPRSETNGEEVTMDLMPEFPLTSVEEYIQFNEKLKNDDAIRKCFNKKIRYIGGDSVQKMVSNILTNCITFDVGHKLSWTGAKNSIAIENSTFANIIIGIVSHEKGKGPGCTIALIVKHIKNWLQHAGDKMRYRLKKDKGHTST